MTGQPFGMSATVVARLLLLRTVKTPPTQLAAIGPMAWRLYEDPPRLAHGKWQPDSHLP